MKIITLLSTLLAFYSCAFNRHSYVCSSDVYAIKILFKKTTEIEAQEQTKKIFKKIFKEEVGVFCEEKEEL